MKCNEDEVQTVVLVSCTGPEGPSKSLSTWPALMQNIQVNRIGFWDIDCMNTVVGCRLPSAYPVPKACSCCHGTEGRYDFWQQNETPHSLSWSLFILRQKP